MDWMERSDHTPSGSSSRRWSWWRGGGPAPSFSFVRAEPFVVGRATGLQWFVRHRCFFPLASSGRQVHRPIHAFPPAFPSVSPMLSSRQLLARAARAAALGRRVANNSAARRTAPKRTFSMARTALRRSAPTAVRRLEAAVRGLPTIRTFATAPADGLKYTATSQTLDEWTPHEELKAWVRKQAALVKPDNVHLVTGSEAEYDMLMEGMVKGGTMIKCNDELRPNSYLARSTTTDVARVEKRTYICSEHERDAGPTNNWAPPVEMKEKLHGLFDGCMKGRTMYVVPFCMGPLNSELSAVGVQITDSAYATAHMRIMTRMGKGALDMIGSDGFYVPCMHSVGAPLEPGQADAPWPENIENKYITHFPETKEIWSYGSGYGGNALLGKKCYALRIASIMAREEGWMAEHMLILGVTNPQGVKKYFAAAFPSACGKTNFAMLQPSLPGWKIETVGDDIAWMRVNKETGKLHAINPEAGFFGVAPGTSEGTNPMALASCSKNSIFTNVAMTEDGDVWWEGMDKPEPGFSVTSWLRRPWTAGESEGLAAHPNSRFTAPASQCPTLDPDWENTEGVPIDAIIFGGRRSDTVPLVTQSLDWDHGVYMGATMSSEATAAAESTGRNVRNDPFAMLPFCGYNAADYFQHWLSMKSRTDESKLPSIFFVNWFRKDENGSFIWPGFGDNVRVVEWIMDRCDATAANGAGAPDPKAVATPVGYLPSADALNTEGLNLSDGVMESLTTIRAEELKVDVDHAQEFLDIFGDSLPKGMQAQQDRIADAVKSM